jgi:hypothetical protein
MENTAEQINKIVGREMHDRRYQLFDKTVKGYTSKLTDKRDKYVITFNLKRRYKR